MFRLVLKWATFSIHLNGLILELDVFTQRSQLTRLIHRYIALKYVTDDHRHFLKHFFK